MQSSYGTQLPVMQAVTQDAAQQAAAQVEQHRAVQDARAGKRA